MKRYTSIIFGIESGSNRILTIMEKKVKVEDNIKALKLLKECGLFTIIQLVIGMPGENNETIKETINFLNDVVGYVYDPMLLSVNYAQALPGSTLYDYALLKKYINNDIDSQEEYLLKISDVNAADIKHYINMTSENMYNVMTWQSKIGYSFRLEAYKKGKINYINNFEKYKIIFFDKFPFLFLLISFIRKIIKQTKWNVFLVLKLFFISFKKESVDIETNSLRNIVKEETARDCNNLGLFPNKI